MRVLVVDDQPEILQVITEALSSENIEAVTRPSGEGLFAAIAEHNPDAILLDQMMPGKTGFELLLEIRGDERYQHLPILMVTGVGEEQSVVEALENGADDYVTKPFMGKALAARIRAVVRRAQAGTSLESSEVLQTGELKMDLSSHRVFFADQEVELTLTEFKILSELLKEQGRVLTRDKLRERALGNLNVTDRTIDVHMASLRKKLPRIGEEIQTVRGVGYRFEPTH